MSDFTSVLADLQSLLIEQGAMTAPVQCGQITLNLNEGHIASVHIEAVHRINGRPKDWHIPMRTGVLRPPLDTDGGLRVK